MDKQQAQEIIKTTFEKPFEKGRFAGFLKNLLNQIEDAPFTYRGNYIPDAYKQYVASLERIGKYNDGEHQTDLLIVQLKKETSLERARTMQRNFVAWYLNGSRGGERKDAALVAFVSPGEEDWRFSLVKMDYRFEETETGKLKVKEEFTPARRWSFLVGRNEAIHTAQSRLVSILAYDEHNPTLAQLEEAFNIEKVAKEFFEKYRELFLWTKETLDEIVEHDSKIKTDFEAKGVNTVDFAKKLLGQIVFLYFLQKKGWFGVERDAEWGTGSKQFLRELFKGTHGKLTNFFNDILEPLFYEALRIDRRHDDDYYSRFNCKIPFLNGGLFDPIVNYDWVHTDILLPNELFSNRDKTKEGDTGNGILDIFDRYNFTVKEDEPLEKEVAVDPEMLGKVFENLLEVKDRKSKGTYYTPREIVHYMCQQSLINYLYTELDKGTIAYQKIGESQLDTFGNKVKDGQFDLTEEHKSSSQIAKEDIETLIKYGEQVGENEAVVTAKGKETYTYSYKLSESIRQNAKLIDEKLANIKICDPAIGSGAFPVGMMHEIVKARYVLTFFIKDMNRTVYNFKRECIEKSLYGVDIDPGAVEIAKLRLWLSLVVDEEDIKQIKPLPNLDYKIVCANSLMGVSKDLLNTPLLQKLEQAKQSYFNETSPSKKQKNKQRIDELISKITNGHTEFVFEVYFSEVFHKKIGFDIVIGNPPYGADIEKADLKKIKLKAADTNNSNSAALFIDFSKNRLISKNGTLAFIVPKSLLFSERWFSLVQAMSGRVASLVDVEKAFEKVKLEQVVFIYGNSIRTERYLAKKFLNNEFIRSTKIPYELVRKYKAWLCDVSEEELQIIKNLKSKYVHLNSISSTKRGIGLQRFLTNTGDFPVIGGKNIFRYGYSGTKGFLSNKVVQANGKKISFMQQPKIISQRLIAHVTNPSPRIIIMSCYDQEGNVLNVDTVENTILSSADYDYKYILSILNCTFTSWYAYKFIFCSAIRTMDFDNYYIGKIIIPAISKIDQQPFITLVDRILAITKDEDYLQNPQKQSRVKVLEREIDQMVYKLYGLTEEEKQIVEGDS